MKSAPSRGAGKESIRILEWRQVESRILIRDIRDIDKEHGHKLILAWLNGLDLRITL